MTKTITVTQPAFETHYAAYGMPLPATAGAPYSTDSHLLHFVGSIGLPYSVTVPAGSWLSLSGSVSGTTTGDERAYYHAGVNPGPAARQAIATVTIGNYSQTVGITQSGSVLTLSPSPSLSVAAAGIVNYRASVTATSGLSWNVVSGNTGIVTVHSKDASGFYFNVSNNSGAARNAVITVTGGDHKQTLTISQALGVDPRLIYGNAVLMSVSSVGSLAYGHSFCAGKGGRLLNNTECEVFMGRSDLPAGYQFGSGWHWCGERMGDKAIVWLFPSTGYGNVTNYESTESIIRCVRNLN